jgi:hypothetical protein
MDNKMDNQDGLFCEGAFLFYHFTDVLPKGKSFSSIFTQAAV